MSYRIELAQQEVATRHRSTGAKAQKHTRPFKQTDVSSQWGLGKRLSCCNTDRALQSRAANQVCQVQKRTSNVGCGEAVCRQPR